MTQAVLFTGGSERWHDLLGGAQVLAGALSRGGIGAALSQDFAVLADRRTDEADLLLFYTCEKPWSPGELAALEQRLAEGRGALFLHAANVILPGQEAYGALVGSRFLGHPPFGRFTVEVRPGHPITTGLGDFAIDDELYQIEWTGEPGEVLATAVHEGVVQPLVYTRPRGPGRICYIALGHDGRSWHHPSFQQLLIQAARWAADKA
ncbi:MAG: ThuA domain-containing protein [Bacillota bacterium]